MSDNININTNDTELQDATDALADDEQRIWLIRYGQGPAKEASPADIKMDYQGIVNPNLHRRTYPEHIVAPEVKIRDYEFGIYSLNDYRTRRAYTHDEESTTSEIP